MLQCVELVLSLLHVISMSSSTSNCWMYFLGASSPWKALKKLFFLNNLFLLFFFLLFFILTSQAILHHQVILRWSFYWLPNELLSIQAFESMNDPHIRCLQMACAVWGEKCNFNILQSSGIFCVCSTLVNEGKISMFFISIWQSNCTRISSKVAEVIHELEFALHLVGSFFTFLKQCGLLYLPVTSGGNFSVPSTLQSNRTMTLCFDCVPPWQVSPVYVNVLLGWRL